MKPLVIPIGWEEIDNMGPPPPDAYWSVLTRCDACSESVWNDAHGPEPWRRFFRHEDGTVACEHCLPELEESDGD